MLKHESFEASGSLGNGLLSSSTPRIAVPELKPRYHCFSIFLTALQAFVALMDYDSFWVAMFTLGFLVWSIACFGIANRISARISRKGKLPLPVQEISQLLARFLLVQVCTLIFTVCQLVSPSVRVYTSLNMYHWADTACLVVFSY